MASFIATLARFVFARPPEILCSKLIWQAGTDELRRRTLGRRESGAFLLGRKGRFRVIEEFVFYDDIDPHALITGIVTIDGRRLSELWKHCRTSGREVVADIHVHPGHFAQSESDRSNPIMAEIGHFAIILPDYANGSNQPGNIGIYEYQGNRSWRVRSFERFAALHIGWWPWR
jgi:hypothetical protein